MCGLPTIENFDVAVIERFSSQLGKLYQVNYNLLNIIKIATFTGLPWAKKKAVHSFFQKEKKMKVEDCTEVDMSSVAVYLAKHKFNNPLPEMPNVPPQDA